MVQWLGLYASNAGVVGSIPGQRTKIPHAMWRGQKIKNKWCVKVVQSCPTFCDPINIQSMEFSRPEYWSG